MREPGIRIVRSDPSWPAAFVEERTRLQSVLSPWLAGDIEHVGSTAVPGLAAKPVIDVMAPVRSLEDSRAAIAALSSAGYAYYPYKAEAMHWFFKPSPEYRTHHLHLVPRDSALWHERLAFRDALREDDSLCAAYSALKRRLARQFQDDREAYTEGKTSFVLAVVQARRSGKTLAAPFVPSADG